MDTVSHAAPLAGVPITPTDPGLARSELPRLTRQCYAMLGLLAARPQWNYEMALVGLSYTRRLSDLRAAGFKVERIQTGEHGARLYGLVVPCPSCPDVEPWTVPICPACGSLGSRLVGPDLVPGYALRPILLAQVESLSWGIRK